jgi:hypothetical protein
VLRNQLCEGNQDRGLQCHLAMVLHSIALRSVLEVSLVRRWEDQQENVRILGHDKFYPVESEGNQVRDDDRDQDELESFNTAPEPLQIAQ